MERREQLDAPNSQVNVIYNIQPGKQAKVGNVKVDGTPGMSLGSVSQDQQTEGGQQGEPPDGEPCAVAAAQVLRQKAALGRRGDAGDEGVSREHQPAGLPFQAREGPLVKVQVEGAKYSRSAIERLVPIYEEGTVDLDLVNEGAHNLRADLQGKGYFDATVTHEPVHNSKDEITVLYKVDRGVEHRVDSVRIEGAKYFDDDTLAEHISVRPANFIERHGTYSQALVDSDVTT